MDPIGPGLSRFASQSSRDVCFPLTRLLCWMIDARPVASKMFSIHGSNCSTLRIYHDWWRSRYNWIGERIAMSRSASEQVAAIAWRGNFFFFFFFLSLVYGFFRESFASGIDHRSESRAFLFRKRYTPPPSSPVASCASSPWIILPPTARCNV